MAVPVVEDEQSEWQRTPPWEVSLERGLEMDVVSDVAFVELSYPQMLIYHARVGDHQTCSTIADCCRDQQAELWIVLLCYDHRGLLGCSVCRFLEWTGEGWKEGRSSGEFLRLPPLLFRRGGLSRWTTCGEQEPLLCNQPFVGTCTTICPSFSSASALGFGVLVSS